MYLSRVFLFLQADSNNVSLLINCFIGGFLIIYGYFVKKYESLKILSGYNEKTMPYIDKKRLSSFIGICLINAGTIVFIPNLLVTILIPNLIKYVGITSYVLFGLIILYMIIITNKEGKPGGKFTKRDGN